MSEEKEKRRIWTAKQKSEVVLEGLKEKETGEDIEEKVLTLPALDLDMLENLLFD
jgi:hypothetical protein